MTKKTLKKTGVSASKFGRKRLLLDAKLPGNRGMRPRIEAALRQGVNGPIQGDASDVCLWGLVRLQKWLDENQCRTRIKATIHDSVVLSVPLDELEEVHSNVVRILTNPGLPWLDGVDVPGVPLRVSAAVGETWGDLIEVDS